MGAAFFSLACLSMVLGQVDADMVFSKDRKLQIPLTFSDNRKADIREMILYTSTDRGKTWTQAQVVPVEKTAILFEAPNDGEYWLQVAAINRKGKQEPESPYTSPAQQKMIIDTLRPFVRLTPTRQADEIVVAWDVQEDFPDWKTFQMEYQVQPTLQWTKVPVQPAYSGETRFNVPAGSTVVVRLSVSDLAQNVTTETKTLTGTGNNVQLVQDVTPIKGTPTVAPNPAFSTVTPPPNAPMPPPTFPTDPPQFKPLQEPANLPKNLQPPQDLTPKPVVVEPIAPREEVRPQPAPVAQDPPRPVTPPVYPPKPREAPTIADSTAAPPPLPIQTTSTTTTVHRQRALPALQYVNSPEITLEYEISKVGPSGVGLVHFYITRDEGQTWKPYGYDDQDLKPGRHQRTVRLDGDGVYGFVVVVKNRAGLGREEPKPGDAPDIRFEVDTLTPVAKLFEPRPDPTRPNTLILGWHASDNNLAPNPISLEWAEKSDGPWRPIALNLANSKEHAWALPDGLPYQVYLRLRVRDLAGNEGIAATPQPQIVDLSRPEGKVVGVGVAPR